MMYDISTVSNRDLQLLYEYRILRRPADRLTAILEGKYVTVSVKEGTKLEDNWYTYYLDTTTIENKVPFLEFIPNSADDWRAVAHLSKAEVFEDNMIRLYTTAEIPTNMQVRVYWCESLHQIESMIDELYSMLDQFNAEFDKLKADIEFLKEHAITDSRPEGLVNNLVKIKQTDNGGTLVDALYTIQKPESERLYVNPSQADLDTMVHVFNEGVTFKFVDGFKRILHDWTGSVMKISGTGSLVLRNITAQILISDWNGYITVTDCPDVHIQSDNADSVCNIKHLKLMRNSCVYLENYTHYIENITMLLNSTLRHRRGYVRNITYVGYGCTYWCADTVWVPGINYLSDDNHTQNTVYNFNTLNILGTLQHDGNALLIHATRCIGFKTANADAPAQPSVVNSVWNAEYEGGDTPTPIPPTPTDPIVDPGEPAERCHVLYVWLRKSGFSQNHTCGILGNIQAESSFDPNIKEIKQGDPVGYTWHLLDMVNYPNDGYGLIQWTFPAGHSWLYNWCVANNYNYDTLDGQIRCAAAVPMGYKLSDSVGQGGYDIFGHDGAGTASYNYHVYQYGNSTYSWVGTGEGTPAEVFSKLNALSLENAVYSWLASMERPNTSVMGGRVENARAILEQAIARDWESEV